MIFRLLLQRVIRNDPDTFSPRIALWISHKSTLRALAKIWAEFAHNCTFTPTFSVLEDVEIVSVSKKPSEI